MANTRGGGTSGERKAEDDRVHPTASVYHRRSQNNPRGRGRGSRRGKQIQTNYDPTPDRPLGSDDSDSDDVAAIVAAQLDGPSQARPSTSWPSTSQPSSSQPSTSRSSTSGAEPSTVPKPSVAAAPDR